MRPFIAFGMAFGFVISSNPKTDLLGAPRLVVPRSSMILGASHSLYEDVILAGYDEYCMVLGVYGRFGGVEVREKRVRQKMASSSFNMEDLSPKSKMMIEYMKKLKEKLGLLGLESRTIDSHIKKKSSSNGDSHDESCSSKTSRSHRSKKVVRRDERPRDEQKKSPWDLIKGKIPPFSSNVEENLDCINCEDSINVKLIALSFEECALIWWNEIVLQIKDMRRASIESWEELKRDMRERFIPSYY
ncbi:hypothetical protein CR513_07423, partial [Mucuna pruriens]